MGALAPEVVDALRQHGVELSSAAVTVARRQLAHAARDAKGERGAALDDADWDRLPAIVADPEAILLDTRKGGDRVLVFAFSPADGDRKGKVVVRAEFSVRHRRQTRASNSIRSAGYVQPENLRAPYYEPLAGDVE